MRTSARTIARTRLMMAVGLLLVVLATGCTPKKETDLAKALEGVSPAEVANQVAREHGVVLAAHEGQGTPIIAFQEMHSSILQQAQIAAMLNRLYVQFGLRTIGVEGACLGEDEFLVPETVRGTYEPLAPLNERELAAVQMLANGEIRAPELLAILYPDVRIEPIERASDYAVGVSSEGSAEPVFYLAMIAFAHLPEEEQERILSLEPEESASALLDAIDVIPSTKELMDAMSGSCTCDTARLDEIATLAVEYGVSTREEVDANFAELRRFYAAACTRGRFMAGQMLNRIAPAALERGEVVVAIANGAAHCEVPEEFVAAGHAHVVIRPSGYGMEEDPSKLLSEALTRKEEGLPVADSDVLRAALLGPGKNYPPVIGELWFGAMLDVHMITSHIAHEAAGGRVPPLTEETLAGLPLSGTTTVVPDSLSVHEGEVVFAIRVPNENRSLSTIWVRAAVDRAAVEQTLEERLDQLIRDLADGAEQTRKLTATPDTTAIAVSSDVKAAFCASQEVAETIRLMD